MCILLIYVCDQVSDCFDGSDEVRCSYEKMWNVISTSNIVMPHILAGNYSRSQSDINTPVHAICDGINSYNLIYHQDICVTNQPIYINCRAMQNSKDFVSIKGGESLWDINTVWELYQIEMRLKNPPQIAVSLHFKNNAISHLSINKYLEPCKWKSYKIGLEDKCKISVRIIPCNHGSIKNICQYMECPGMFKCHLYYCLPMSAVCDGHHDCYRGDDGNYCKNMTCPGLLKCRGENRCVSEQEICDGYSDCLVSRDDEIMCGKCIFGCECNGYTASCDVDQVVLNEGQLNHIKGLVLKTKTSQIRLKHPSMTALIYINVSHTGIELLYFNTLFSSQSIIFADISSNMFQSSNNISISLFDKVI